MHLFSNIWSDLSVTETESHSEKQRESERGQAGKRKKMN